VNGVSHWGGVPGNDSIDESYPPIKGSRSHCKSLNRLDSAKFKLDHILYEMVRPALLGFRSRDLKPNLGFWKVLIAIYDKIPLKFAPFHVHKSDLGTPLEVPWT
jgi:hypothetical protein